jgi:hypothetical protein
MNTFNLPDDPKIAGKIIDVQSQHESQRLDMGVLGRFFGSKSGAPANAASFVVYAAFATIAAILVFGVDAASFTKKDSVIAISNLLTLALGFLFGKSTKD